MRLWLILILLVMASCGSQSGGNSPPQAGLVAPNCVLAGTRVLIDASSTSDPDGDIIRYIFYIGHRNPPMVLLKPRLNFRFDKASVKGGDNIGYPIMVKAVDSVGNESIAETLIHVVDLEKHCAPYGGMTPPPKPPASTDVELEPEDDILEPPIDLDAIDTLDNDLQDSTTPSDLTSPDDVGTDIAGCPVVAGKYLLQVNCPGATPLELTVELRQDGCTISEASGIVEGKIDESGKIDLDSPFPQLGLASCFGNLDTATGGFDLSCADDCKASYSPL